VVNINNKNNNKEINRALMLLVSLNLMGFAVYYYLSITPYNYIGMYSGWPIYIQSPEFWLLSIFFVLIFISILTLFLSINPTKMNLKISSFLVIGSLASLIIITGIFYSSSLKVFYSLIGGYSDSYIIQEQAAELLLKGKNPYLANFTSYLISKGSFPDYTYLFKNSPPFIASHIIGFVSTYDYLSFAMLYYLPKVILNIPRQIYDAIILAISLFLVYRKSKEPYKTLFPLIIASASFLFVGEPIAFSPVVGWLAPSLIAIAYVDYPLISGALFGLATSYRETAGVLFLFFIVAAYHEKYNIKKMITGFLISGLAINLPFLLLSPHQFIKSVLLPIDSNLMPIGAGLSSLYEFNIDLPKLFYTLLFISIILLGLLVYFKFYNKLKYSGLIIPSIAFLFYYRPLPIYYMWFPLISIIAYATSLNKKENYFEKNTISNNWTIYTFILLLSSVIIMMVSYVLQLSLLLLILGLLAVLGISLITFFIGSDKINSRYNPKIMTFIFLSLLILTGILASRFFPQISLFIVSRGYQSSQEIAMELAAMSITKLHNPYNLNYYRSILNDKTFGYLVESIPYTQNPLNLNSLDPQKKFSLFYNTTRNSWNNVTVYDYLPGLAISYLPAIMLNIPSHIYSSILFAIAITLVGIISVKNNKDPLLIIGILMTFYISIIFFMNSIIITISLSILIISIVLLYYNSILSGIIYSLSILIYPQFIISMPFYLIYIYYEFNNSFNKFISALLTSLAFIISIFSITSQNFFKYGFMQLLYKIKGNYSLGYILNINPIYLILTDILITILLALYYKKGYSNIKEFGLLIPLAICIILPSMPIQLLAFYSISPFLFYILKKKE
jgi:uncharacterized membrane protein